MATTVLLISAAYRRIIEEFPSGGGGYVVASKLLGASAGVVSGSALLVDYVLTITISHRRGRRCAVQLPARRVARLPGCRSRWAASLVLTTLNMRGVRESVLALLPVFLLFLVTHALVIGGGLLLHATDLPTTIGQSEGYRQGISTVGAGGCCCFSSGPTRSAAGPTPASRRSPTACR